MGSGYRRRQKSCACHLLAGCACRSSRCTACRHSQSTCKGIDDGSVGTCVTLNCSATAKRACRGFDSRPPCTRGSLPLGGTAHVAAAAHRRYPGELLFSTEPAAAHVTAATSRRPLVSCIACCQSLASATSRPVSTPRTRRTGTGSPERARTRPRYWRRVTKLSPAASLAQRISYGYAVTVTLLKPQPVNPRGRGFAILTIPV